MREVILIHSRVELGYIGEEGGEEGVKLEQQILVTNTGIELLSEFPFEEELAG